MPAAMARPSPRVRQAASWMVVHSRWMTAAKSVSLEVPPLPEPQEKSPAPGGTAARDALAALLSGAQITLKQADAQKTDRYDRIIAYAFAKRDGADHAVQADLIAAGHARVAARVGNRACAMELLRRETLARKAKLGLWGQFVLWFA